MNKREGYLDLVSKSYIDKSKKQLGIWDVLKGGKAQ